MLKFKDIIRNIMPYGLIEYRRKKMSSPLDIYAGIKTSLLKEEKTKYEYIVSVQGFGYSGSGAVLDLLREYDGLDVIGYVDFEGSKTPRNQGGIEIDFIRLAGGLFEMEKYLSSTNIFHNDALIHRFIKLLNSGGLLRNGKIKNIVISFLSEIIEFSIGPLSYRCYNGYLGKEESKSAIFFLRNMSVAQFRSISNRFLTHFFNVFAVNNSRGLVVDQLFSDLEFDIERNRQYLPNLKSIIVVRDPRDVYVFAKENNIEWIPTSSVELFIAWQKKIYSKLPLTDSSCLVIQFEDVVENYDTTISQIENYLRLSKEQHVRKLCNFDPAISIKNVGVWKHFPQYSNDVDIIKQALL